MKEAVKDFVIITVFVMAYAVTEIQDTMKKLLLLLSLLIVSCAVDPVQEVNPYVDCAPEVIAPEATSYIQGCVIPDNLDFNPATGKMQQNLTKSSVVTGKDRLFPLGIVPYYFHPRTVSDDGVVFDNYHDEEGKAHIRKYLKKDSELTGIIYKEYPSSEALRKDYNYGVVIAKSPFKASSHVGRKGGVQVLFLGTESTEQTILHELGHLKGKNHVFCRSDRNEYVIIHYDNIYEKYWPQFEIKGRACGDYPEWTIMDYYWNAYAIDPEKPTKTNLDGEIMEMPETLTEADIQTDKALYKYEFEKREN